MAKSVYVHLRTVIEENGGTMTYYREGYPQGGAWVINFRGKEKTFYSTGHGFPEIDGLHVPKIENPSAWWDYKRELVENVLDKLERILSQ